LASTNKKSGMVCYPLS